MNPSLKQYLIDNFGLAADADDAAAKSLAQEKIKSGDLSLDKYNELISKSSGEANAKADELAKSIASQTTSGVVSGLAPMFEKLTSAIVGKAKEEKEEEVVEETEKSMSLEEMEQKLIERMKKEFAPAKGDDGGDAQKLWKMSLDDTNDPRAVRVKAHVERYSHTPTAHAYKGRAAKLMGIDGQPILLEDGREVNQLTQRTKFLSAVWAKFQIFPENMTEHELETVQWILHKEKFHVPNRGNGQPVYLTEDERFSVFNFNKNFYTHPRYKALLDDSTSGGENAVPEFFDMDFIMSPTLASENIPMFCNIVSVPRGSSAENFILGRPTIAAETDGSAVTVFTTTSLIANHDTPFFRAAGFMEIGNNFLQDAHPGILGGIYQQYMNSVLLWLNEQIMAGDGTTEPQGVLVDTGTGDITPGNPTTGAILLADALNMLFGVGKAYRENGGRNNAIYCMTDQTYKRFRSIATGVTGDTRLVFGESVEDYQLFGHPVLIEENGLSNSTAVFFQAKGYRLYQRQQARFIRETSGDALTRKNVTLVGVDVRYGGQLDEPEYAAVVDSFQA